MTEGIIVAIITGVCAAIVALIGQAGLLRKNRAADAAERARLDERTAIRLASIERKLDEHNHYAEKLGDLQQDVAVIRTQIEQLEKRG